MTKNCSDTLKFISTHVINKNIINEYLKLCKSGDDVILCINNSELHIQSDFPVCEKNFYGTKVKCFLFDENIHKKMNLPNYCYSEETDNFGKIQWYNADYHFYYVKEYFPNYKYYWRIEYDVYCNGDSYKPFFDKYKNKSTHLLITNFCGQLKNSEWRWTHNLDWIYDWGGELYGSIFPVCRLENSAITYLYQKRLEQAEKFKSQIGNKNSEWTFCEVFVPSELMNAGFKCNTIGGEKINAVKQYFQGDECFNTADNLLYHSYKGKYIRKTLKLAGLKIKWKEAVRKEIPEEKF